MAGIEIDESSVVNGTALALVLGLTKRRIQQLAEDGNIPALDGGLYPLADAVQAYMKYTDRRAPSEEDIKIEQTRKKSEALLKSSKAKMAKAEADELVGKMHRSEDVAAMTEDLLYTIRGMLVALPGRLADETHSSESAAEAEQIIRKEVFSVMDALSKYQYDPRKYEERVRERRNWAAAYKDGEDSDE